jgi:DNA polymerase I-like protein with 3'-5' exonuclease and polymerase domains
VTYLVKCHTPEGRSPSASEVKACKAYLEAEIAQVKPEIIMTLGAPVLKALAKKSKVTEMHGQLVPYGDSQLYPTFHPAMALRDPARLPALRKDAVKLGHILAGNAPTEADMHWHVIRSLKAWNEFIVKFRQSKEFSFDIETTGLDEHDPQGVVNSLQIGLDNDENYAIPLGVAGSPWNFDRQQMFVETLVETQAEVGNFATGWNAKFDNRWLKKKYGVKFYLHFDGMLAHHLIDENSPHGLKETAAERCNAPSYDVPLRIKQGKFKNKDEETQFYKYGCFDVHWTLDLMYQFRRILTKDASQRRLFFKLVMPAARMFEEIEEEGHYIHLDRMDKVRTELTARMVDIEQRMNAMVRKAGVKQKINWDSPAQIARVFYTHMGMPVLEKTGKGAPSTAETVLLRLAEEHPLAKLLIERRGIAKNLSTYVDGLKELMHGNRLILSTKLHGTVTGRYSSRLHQIPRDPLIRSLIDAPPEDNWFDEVDEEGVPYWTFVSADYSQIELRIAAMLSNDRVLKQIFQTGGDVHAETASFILSKAVEALTKEERKQAKPVNFGFLYGMGAPKFVIYARDNYGVTFTESQSQAYRKRYFERYSSLPGWHERQRRCVRAFGQVVSPSGRIRHLPGVYSSEKGIRAEAERQGINSPVQGFGSGDLKAMAMVEIHEAISRDDLRIKGEVHDSILMWIRTSKLKELIPQVKKIMESPKLLETFGINMTVPLVADFEVGPWGMGKPWSN